MMKGTLKRSKIRAEDILRFKTMFEHQRRNLLYTQSLLNESFCVSPDDLLDLADFTTSELETSMRIRLRNREALYLKKIDKALQRISEGCFGHCELCEEPIDVRRLQARPTTSLCIQCKEEQEQKESQHVDGRKPKSLGSKVRLA